MSKKIYIAIILVLIVLSQWIIVKMIYSGAVNGSVALNVSKTYNLKAATIEKNGESLEISLANFLGSRVFAKKLLAIKLDENVESEAVFSLKDEDQLDAIVWDNVIKKAWLENIAKRYDLSATEADLAAGLDELESRHFLEQSELQSFGISKEEYIERVIEPFVLETKVYIWLLENYNDFDGMQKAQLAYESLETGRAFLDVAKDFSDEVQYADSLFWLKESELKEYYEPIKNLEPAGFSKIIIAPGPNGVYYTIWYLDSKTEEEEASYGIKGIYIKARTLDQFYDDYLLGANINKMY